PVPDPKARLRNGGLEETRGDHFVGFAFQDEPGKSTFRDDKVVHTGKLSCRMQDFKHHPAGNCRLSQRMQVRPYTCYRFSAWVKTQDLKPVANFRLLALASGKDGKVLSFYDDPVKSTQDWARVEIVFNSLEYTEVALMSGIWGGKSGTLWLDDL